MTDPDAIAQINPEEAEQLRQKGAVLLDVREPSEWAEGHAPGAEHLPLGTLEGSPTSYGGKTVLVICRSGARSLRASQSLIARGVDARNVTGGMNAWAACGLPVVRDDSATITA